MCASVDLFFNKIAMGRRSIDKVHFFFKFNPTTNQSLCTVCKGKLAGNHVTNLRRHLTAKHSEVFDSFNEDTKETKNAKKRKIAYEATEDGIISSIVKIVTTGGSPFLDSEGFREIISPIYDALQMTPITSENIMEHVCEKELTIKEDITAAVKRKLVSLKIDVVTRQEKSVLLINLHLMSSTLSKTEIVVKTLGMIQLFELHTGIYIKNKILEIIQEYGIQIDQIFSITSDNGKNMAKDIELLNDGTTEESLNDEDDDNGDHFMELLNSMTFPNVRIHRCAAHTLQLCVSDVNKLSEISRKVHICRQMVKVLRTGKFRRTLMENNKPIPALDVATRWSSTYKMIVKLFELREFKTTKITVDIEVDWPWVELYIEAFKETYEATLVLEQEHFSYSDFFILWMELKLKCEKSENFLAKELLAQLKFRETNLLQNETLLAAIYMDPRISLVLTEQQKVVAKGNLKNIALRIFNLNQDANQQVIKQEPSNDDLKNKSLFDSFLDGIQTAPQAPGGEIPDKLSKTYVEIENFSSVYGRLPLSSDIKQFYHDLRFKSPQLSEVAQVVLASPATQVSVERSFSALNFVLNEKRSSLTAENINSLLVVRLNS